MNERDSTRTVEALATSHLFSASLVEWLSTASVPGAKQHRVEHLLGATPEHRREVSIFQLQTKERLAHVRSLIDGPMVLIKGLEVAQLYPEPWQRDYVDVDVVVADADRSDGVLRANGYTPLHDLKTLPDYHQTAALAFPDDPVTVELHRRPNWPRWTTFSVEELLASSSDSRTGVEGLLRPRDDHHLLVLAWHYWRDGAHRGRDLVDLHLLRQQVADEVTDATASDWGVGRAWAQTKALLDDLDGPAGARSRLSTRLLALEPVSHRERRVRQWFGISLGGAGAVREVRERGLRREQRRRTGAPL